MNIIKIIIVIILSLNILGCSMSRKVSIKIEGDKIKTHVGSYIPIQGDNIKMTIEKEMTIGKIENNTQENN